MLPRATPHPTRSIYLIERKVAVNPHADALRIAGTLELVRNDFSINHRRVDVILRGAKAMLNIGEAPVARRSGAAAPLHARRHATHRPGPRPRRRMARDGPSDGGLKRATGTGVLLAH